jgi:hypothetical protein
MLRRLVDGDIILKKYKAGADRIKWWFIECRNAGILMDLAKRYHRLAKESAGDRPLISSAIRRDERGLSVRLDGEEAEEREKDIAYWIPLKKELEALRHQALSRKNKKS